VYAIRTSQIIKETIDFLNYRCPNGILTFYKGMVKLIVRGESTLISYLGTQILGA